MYKMRDSVVLVSGRSVPPPGEARQRGEGMAIVLRGQGVQAWKAAGERWKAWSSRLITAVLLSNNKIGPVHIICCYAPTFAIAVVYVYAEQG